MLILALGLALTTILLAKVGYWRRAHGTDRGSMSHQWVAAYNASRPSSSL